MSSQILVTLPDNIYERVQQLAKLTDKNLDEVVFTIIESAAPSNLQEFEVSIPIEQLNDDEVLAISQLQMLPEQDSRLSELLHKQQDNDINETERLELNALMRIYERGLLRKSEGLREAVMRGLRPPLEP